MSFRERLAVPVLWWVMALLFAFSMVLAFGFYLGPVWGVGAGLATVAVAAGIFVSAGIVVSVDPEVLRVGRAVLEHRFVADVRALDAAQTRARSGVQADARAYLALRPYIATAVEITLDDPDDPVPYWLVSTRRPVALAEALRGARAGGAH